jgi:hypothetical protein
MPSSASSFYYNVKLDSDNTYTGTPKIKCGIYNTSESALGLLTSSYTSYEYSNFIKCSVQPSGVVITPVSCTYNLPVSLKNESLDLKISLGYTSPSTPTGSYGSCTLSAANTTK